MDELEFEWRGHTFKLYRHNGIIYVKYGYVSRPLFTETLEEGKNKVISELNKKFSYKYRGWYRPVIYHSILVALGVIKGYNYRNKKALYEIAEGTRKAFVGYIDDDMRLTFKYFDPFIEIDAINEIVKKMKNKIPIIEHTIVTRNYTVYKISKNRKVIIGKVDNTIGIFLDGRELDKLDTVEAFLEINGVIA